MNVRLYEVSSAEAGIRLLAFLREKCGNLASVKAIKRAVESGACKIDGKIERFSTRILAFKERVAFDPAFLEIKKEPLSLPILYEDEELLICNKPPGLVSENKAINALLPSYRGSLDLIHRLDKETSGALLIAKTKAMKEAMIELFREEAVHKKYLALAYGKAKKHSGKIEAPLVKKQSYQGQTLWGVAPHGLRAVTLWKCLKVGKEVSLFECTLVTGRTHQLRVHLSSMGHPILGDLQYGRSTISHYRPKRMLLHAMSLSFVHPTTHKLLEIQAPLFADMQQAIAALC